MSRPSDKAAARAAEPPGDATPFLPDRRGLRALREAAADCRGCGLHEHATQTVSSARGPNAPA